MSRIRIAAFALAGCLTLSACGQGGTAPTPSDPGGSPVTTSPGQPDPTATPAPATSPAPGRPTLGPPRPQKTPGGSTSSGPMTISGTISAGVEANCLLLNGYLLIRGPRDVLRAGARVTVTGRVQPGLMTTCQQGTPFVVDSARAG